ncbi:hypothetical protein NC652_011974 [Populus alba x Populus x berolinensis]|nr:hypothetical protein NC652_011974 [Populus alba x Populus x berolinensis]
MKLILKVSIGAARFEGRVHCNREFIRTRSLFYLSKNISKEVDGEMALISSSIKEHQMGQNDMSFIEKSEHLCLTKLRPAMH